MHWNAREFLESVLADGPLALDEVIRRGRALNISFSSICEAVKDLPVLEYWNTVTAKTEWVMEDE